MIRNRFRHHKYPGRWNRFLKRLQIRAQCLLKLLCSDFNARIDKQQQVFTSKLITQPLFYQKKHLRIVGHCIRLKKQKVHGNYGP